MPAAPKRPCAQPGCGALVDRGYCPAHVRVSGRDATRRRFDERRGSSAQRGYDAAWRKLRTWHLGQHPLCVACQKRGLVKAATDVDHIVPFDGVDDPKRLDPKNLQSLCHECHSRKTATEDSGFAPRKSYRG